MSDDVRVPIKAWLRGSTFRILVKHAEQRHMTVGQVLVLLAEQATRERTPTGRRPYTRMTPELLNRIVELRGQGKTTYQIGAAVNVPQASVHRHLKKLGLNR